VIQRVEITLHRDGLRRGDGLDCSSGPMRRDRVWHHAPADVIDHYTQVWTTELHEDWSDTAAWTVSGSGTLTAVDGQAVMTASSVGTYTQANCPIADIDGDWEIETGIQVMTDPWGLGVYGSIAITTTGSVNGIEIRNRQPGGTSRYGITTPDPSLGAANVAATIAGDTNSWGLHHVIRIRRAGRWLMGWVDDRLAMAVETGAGSLGTSIELSLLWFGPAQGASPQNPNPANTCTATFRPDHVPSPHAVPARTAPAAGDPGSPRQTTPPARCAAANHNLGANSGFWDVLERPHTVPDPRVESPTGPTPQTRPSTPRRTSLCR